MPSEPGPSHLRGCPLAGAVGRVAVRRAPVGAIRLRSVTAEVGLDDSPPVDERHSPRRLARRRTDRVEDLAAVLLCALGVVVVLLGVLGGLAAHGAVVERAAREASERIRVEAEVTAVAPSRDGDGAATGTRWADATWIGPDGAAHSQRISVPIAARPGSHLVMWLDGERRQVTPPTSPHAGPLIGVVVAACAVALGVLLLLGLWRQVLRVTARRNAQAWENGWAEVEPHWSGRTPTV